MKSVFTNIFAAVFFFVIFSCSFGNDYDTRKQLIDSDSLFLTSEADSLSSPYVKAEVKELLKKISLSKKIFRPFKVDIYRTEGHKFVFDHQSEMTISDMLDHIEERTKKAKILRINQLDLDNGKKFVLTDNSFKVLEKEPLYRSKEKVMEMIEQTALGPDKKSSLEWIWGKSTDNDAYYSTKLTYFDDQFSLYPEYRFFIGSDPFRDKNSWFFTLKDHPEVQERVTVAEAQDKHYVPEEKNEEIFRTGGSIEPAAEEVFDCGCPHKYPDISLDIVMYEQRENEQFAVNKTMSFSELFELSAGHTDTKFIRLKGTDFSFEGSEVKKTESESVIEITGDIQICADRLKKYLSEGLNSPNVKRTAELIYSKDKNGMSYYAAVITVYDGQATYFPEYKIYASSEVRKDKTSWFNMLEIIK